MQVNEAFAVRKIEGNIHAGVAVMRGINSLIRLPELAGTMRELSGELIKAGIIEEMVGESLPEEGLGEVEEEAAEREVDKVLGEILKDRITTPGKLPAAPIDQEPVAVNPQGEDTEMDTMRNRLEALRT
jgi:charged multivesicular body protein 3